MIVVRRKSYLIIPMVVIGLVILCFGVFVLSRVSFAESTPLKWSWTGAEPVTYSSAAVANIDAGLCSNSGEVKEVSGYLNLKDLCMTSGNSFSFGFYDGGYAFRTAVGFRFDANMYQLNSPCENRIDSCIYLPETDTLVTKQYCGTFCKSLVVFKHFSTRLQSVITPGLITKLEYNFDTSNPDYIFKTDSNYIWGVGGIGASDNGKWLAVEIKQRGIGLLNIDTLQMKIISRVAPAYNVGLDPTEELTVDDNGEHVATAGVNSGLHIFDVTGDCGGEATYDAVMGYIYGFPYCKEANINVNSFIPHFKTALQPKFNREGSELRFYASSYVYIEPHRQVILRVNGYNPPRLDYLALGDSYSSGEGESNQNHYLNGTNDAYENCHVSDRSYPFLIAKQFDMNMDYMKSVACSGATTKDVIGSDVGYLGQNDRFSIKGINSIEEEIVLAKEYAKYNFIPGRIHQEYFVDSYKPKVITIGIGGNDANLMGKLKSCFGLYTCDWASDNQKKEQTANEIKDLFPKLVNTYKKLITDSPSAKIYAIGYPQIIDDSDDCGGLGKLLDRVERQYMTESVHYLNQVVESAARSVGIKYIDIENSYGDDIICGTGSQSAVNAIQLGNLEEFLNNNNFILIKSESFHPNDLGHQKDAEAIIDEVGDIADYDYCQNGQIVCPDVTVIAPDPSVYWSADGLRYTPILLSTNFMLDRITNNLLDVTIQLESGSLKPDSTVAIEVHSDPVPLGQFTVAADGSLSVSVQLPENLEEGYHTVFLHGTTYSNLPVDIYKIFTYEKVKLPDSSQIIDDQNGGGEGNGSQSSVSQIKTDNNIGASTITTSDAGANQADTNGKNNSQTKSNSDDRTNQVVAQVSELIDNQEAVKGASISSANSQGSGKIDVTPNDNYGVMIIFAIVGAIIVFVFIALSRKKL